MKVDRAYYFVCVFVLSCLKYVQGKCGSGTFPSKFAGSDACVDCPQQWIYCKNEAAEDIKACEEFCGKVSQTPTPLPELPLVTVAGVDVGNDTTGATSHTADTRQRETSSVTVQPTFSAATIDVDNVTTGTTGATSDTADTGHWHETSSTGDWVYILIAILSGLALILVVFMLWLWRQRVKELKNADEENNVQELNSLNHSSSSSSPRVGGIQESDSHVHHNYQGMGKSLNQCSLQSGRKKN